MATETANSGRWATPRRFELEAGGHRLAAEWRGPMSDQAPTLIFLHDGLGSIDLWRDVPAALGAATGCGVLVYDRWGHGQSEPLPLPHRRSVNFLHDEGLDTVSQILDATDVRRAILVGHSDGGTISLLAASSIDTRIAGVIAEAAHVFVEDETVAAIEGLVAEWQKGELREKLKSYHGDNVDGVFLGWSGVWLHPEFEDFTIESYLAAITCPVLAIQGDKDEFGTKRQLDAIKHGVWARATAMYLSECGHSPHHQARDETLDAMIDFINETIA